MADKYDEYREHAFHCRKMAESAHAPDLKANWLHLAENWLSMIPNMPAAKQDFGSLAGELTTGQVKSESSH